MMSSETTAVYVGKSYLSRNLGSLHDYAEASHLYELLSQATKILLKKNNVASGQVLVEFLQQCNRGEHVLLKSYGSFSKSVLCKMCFLHNFLKIFDVESIQRNGLDYYQLSRLLCSDFPREFIQKAAGLLVPNEDVVNQMYKLLPSKQFSHAIYLFVIYSDYLQFLGGHFQKQEMDFLQLFRLVKQEDLKNIREYTKPPFSVLAQGILALMKKKKMFVEREVLVFFITEDNFESFIRQSIANHPNKTVNFKEVQQQILESREYCKLVEQNLGMFQNSMSWASDVLKILSTKEPLQAPLNIKKKGTKK